MHRPKHALRNLYKEVCFERMADSKCVSILHAGRFDDELTSFAKMDKFYQKHVLQRSSATNCEIYLNNANRTGKAQNYFALCRRMISGSFKTV